MVVSGRARPIGRGDASVSGEARMPDETLHLCTQMRLPQELAEGAAARAIEENPANARDYDKALKLHGVQSASALPEATRLALPVGKMWAPGRTLRVHLNGGSPKVRAKVQQYAAEWEQHADIVLMFVDALPAEIRVTFAPGGSWSYLGTENLQIPSDKPTMNFGWFNDTTPDEEFSSTVLHEFGHALGCVHEHQSPAANIPWNKPAVYDYYAREYDWSRADVDHNLFARHSASQTQFTVFDPKSIMLYAIPASLTTNGFSTGWNYVLSDTDKAFVRASYPKACFRVFHQGWRNNGQMWKQSTADGRVWSRDDYLAGVGLSAGPSAVLYKGALYLFHQGAGETGALWFSVQTNGRWSADTRVPNTSLSASPSAVVFQDKLHVFHQGAGNSGALWFNVFDGSAWAGDRQVPNTTLSAGPSAVVFGGKLYVFHQGAGNSGALWFNVFDGSTWAGDKQVPNTSLSAGPSAAVFGGKLYVLHQGAGNNGTLWFNVFDGSTWAGDKQVPNTSLSASPCAVTNGDGDRLCVFHQGGYENGQLWCNSFDGTRWLGDVQAPNTSLSSGPGAVWTPA
jgi:hypothetical protein